LKLLKHLVTKEQMKELITLCFSFCHKEEYEDNLKITHEKTIKDEFIELIDDTDIDVYYYDSKYYRDQFPNILASIIESKKIEVLTPAFMKDALDSKINEHERLQNLYNVINDELRKTTTIRDKLIEYTKNLINHQNVLIEKYKYYHKISIGFATANAGVNLVTNVIGVIPVIGSLTNGIMIGVDLVKDSSNVSVLSFINIEINKLIDKIITETKLIESKVQTLSI